MALLCCSTILINPVAQAQSCPGSTGPAPDPSLGCTWTPNTLTNVSMTGGSCSSTCCLTIDYCTRCCGGVLQVFLTEIDVDNEYCDATNPNDMIHFAAGYAASVAALAATGACALPSCTSGTSEVTYYTPLCWTKSALAGEYEFTPCSSLNCWCATTCQECWNGSAIVPSNCSTVTHNPNNECACTANPGTPTWIEGTCYTVPCGD
jgi:hypothetical protein